LEYEYYLCHHYSWANRGHLRPGVLQRHYFRGTAGRHARVDHRVQLWSCHELWIRAEERRDLLL